ncbi:MAG: hypothetical protein NTW12_13805 [Deltaproteobacteria bacterium]|nr:hypothetical protein [Deltaproteobacteria bacterium]
MKLMIKLVSTDIEYNIFFKEPLFNYIEKDWNLHVLRNLIKIYDLKLNDIKINQLSPSDNLYHFMKFFGQSSFDVSLGLEQISSMIRFAISEEQICDLNLRLSGIYLNSTIVRQRFALYQQAEVEGDVNEFIAYLNPWIPSDFKGVLAGKGVTYHFEIPDDNAILHWSLANSLPIKGGLFLSCQLTFEPNNYDFKKSFELARGYYYSFMDSLGIAVQMERK